MFQVSVLGLRFWGFGFRVLSMAASPVDLPTPLQGKKRVGGKRERDGNDRERERERERGGG